MNSNECYLPIDVNAWSERTLHQGHVVMFSPRTFRGLEWVNLNLDIADWQWKETSLGRAVSVTENDANELACKMHAAGLNIDDTFMDVDHVFPA